MNNGEPILGSVPVEIGFDVKKINIVGAKETDSLDSDGWKEYSTSQKLLDAWGVPENSPYCDFQKTKTISSIDKYFDDIKPRYSQGEINSEIGIKELINSGILDKTTAIILDSGGAHSVAMAVKLAEIGWQPVIMFDAEVHPFAYNPVHQELATMLYFAEQMRELKINGNFSSNSPPVFVMDTHRWQKSFFPDEHTVDNAYSYQSSDLPSGEKLNDLEIRKVIYLNEGNQNGAVNIEYQSMDRLTKDLKKVVHDWQNNGIEMIYTGVRPWPHDETKFF